MSPIAVLGIMVGALIIFAVAAKIFNAPGLREVDWGDLCWTSVLSLIIVTQMVK